MCELEHTHIDTNAHACTQQSMVGLLLNGRKLCQRGLLRSPQRCLCFPVRSTDQGMQHGDVQLSSIRAHSASPPGYKGPLSQNGGLLCSCSHRLRLMEVLSADVLISNKTLGSCSRGQCSNKNITLECLKRGHHGGSTCYPHPFKTSTAFEPASINSSDALDKISSKISVFVASSSVEYSSSFANSLPQSRRNSSGLWFRRRDPFCIGSRSFFSAAKDKILRDGKSQSFEDSIFNVPASDAAEVDTNVSSSERDEDFDFRNFPALTSSYYQEYQRPIEMQMKKRVTWQTSRKLFNKETKLTVESIPKPKGRAYDFGLGDMLLKAPPLEAGARPQGGFDTNISMDECEAVPSEAAPSSSLVFVPRMPSRNLPWDTPEADNWSEITTDAQRQEDSVQKPENEFAYDPYDFDPNAKLPHRPEFEENFEANVVSR